MWRVDKTHHFLERLSDVLNEKVENNCFCPNQIPIEEQTDGSLLS